MSWEGGQQILRQGERPLSLSIGFSSVALGSYCLSP